MFDTLLSKSRRCRLMSDTLATSFNAASLSSYPVKKQIDLQ